ncbi:MAG: hypothetical protein ACYC91_07640 [Solirubrobacteraceae bacterium]
MLVESLVAPGGLTPLIFVLVFGFLVGIGGHIVRSRAAILTGIILVGLPSVYVLYAYLHTA